jgi:hypothetical protein
LDQIVVAAGAGAECGNLYVALILGYTQYRIIKGMVNYAALNLIELRKPMLWNKVLMVMYLEQVGRGGEVDDGQCHNIWFAQTGQHLTCKSRLG